MKKILTLALVTAMAVACKKDNSVELQKQIDKISQPFELKIEKTVINPFVEFNPDISDEIRIPYTLTGVGEDADVVITPLNVDGDIMSRIIKKDKYSGEIAFAPRINSYYEDDGYCNVMGCGDFSVMAVNSDGKVSIKRIVVPYCDVFVQCSDNDSDPNQIPDITIPVGANKIEIILMESSYINSFEECIDDFFLNLPDYKPEEKYYVQISSTKISFTAELIKEEKGEGSYYRTFKISVNLARNTTGSTKKFNLKIYKKGGPNSIMNITNTGIEIFQPSE